MGIEGIPDAGMPLKIKGPELSRDAAAALPQELPYYAHILFGKESDVNVTEVLKK